jgi:hypothetical protein
MKSFDTIKKGWRLLCRDMGLLVSVCLARFIVWRTLRGEKVERVKCRIWFF